MTDDLSGGPREGRVRNISRDGAELVMPAGSLPSEALAFCLARDAGDVRQATVVWRRMDRFGIRFGEPSPSAGREPDLLTKLLARRG